VRYAHPGRPPKWNPDVPGTVRAYLRECEQAGIRPTMTGLAAGLQVSRSTLYTWLRHRPELAEAVRDLPVVQSLH